MALLRLLKNLGLAFGISIGVTFICLGPKGVIPADVLVFLFIAFMFADKLDQIINAIKQGNRNNNSN